MEGRTAERTGVAAQPRERWLWPLGVAVVVTLAALAGVGARATGGARTSGDEPFYLMTAQSLAADLDLDIADELAARSYAPYHEIPVEPQTRALTGGRRLSPHDPLLPVLLAPAYALAGWWGAKALLALVAGATAALAWWVAVRRFVVARGVAALAVGGLGATAPLAVYGTQVYPELPAGLAVLAAVATLTAARVRPAGAAVAVAAVVALPWLAVKFVPVAAVLAVALLLRAPAVARRWVVVALAVAGVVYLVAHQAVWGGWTAYAAGDHFADTGELSVVGTDPDHLGRARRLAGLLVDRGFGLVPWSPAWLLLAPALGALVRRRPPGAPLLVAALAAGWGTATFLALTMHGWWFPGRQAVHVLPVAAVVVAWAVDRLRVLLVPAAVGMAAGLVTWGWLAWEATTGRRTLIVDMLATAAPPFRVWGPMLPDGMADAAADRLLLVLWAGLLVAATAWGWAAGGGRPAWRARARAGPDAPGATA